MIRVMLPLLLLTGCTTTAAPSCATADRARAAAAMALQVLDRICPTPSTF